MCFRILFFSNSDSELNQKPSQNINVQHLTPKSHLGLLKVKNFCYKYLKSLSRHFWTLPSMPQCTAAMFLPKRLFAARRPGTRTLACAYQYQSRRTIFSYFRTLVIYRTYKAKRLVQKAKKSRKRYLVKSRRYLMGHSSVTKTISSWWLQQVTPRRTSSL